MFCSLPSYSHEMKEFDDLMNTENHFQKDHPCSIILHGPSGQSEKYLEACEGFRTILRKKNLDEKLIDCIPNMNAEHHENVGMILFPPDRVLNQELFGKKVEKCYKKRRDFKDWRARLAQVDLVSEKAEHFLNASSPHGGSSRKLNLSKEDSTRKMIEKILSQYDNLVIGEKHHGVAAKKAVIENMDLIKKAGAVIAMEHLIYLPYQELLDRYLAEGSDSKMPARLKLFLKALDEGHEVTNPHFGFKAIVEAAKAHGVKIIASETETSTLAGIEEGFGGAASGPKRYQVMNYVHKVITDSERKGAKVVHFVGSAHTNLRHGVPGLSELMNTPSLVIEDGNAKESKRLVEFHVNRGDDDVIADIRVIEPL